MATSSDAALFNRNVSRIHLHLLGRSEGLRKRATGSGPDSGKRGFSWKSSECYERLWKCYEGLWEVVYLPGFSSKEDENRTQSLDPDFNQEELVEMWKAKGWELVCKGESRAGMTVRETVDRLNRKTQSSINTNRNCGDRAWLQTDRWTHSCTGARSISNGRGAHRSTCEWGGAWSGAGFGRVLGKGRGDAGVQSLGCCLGNNMWGVGGGRNAWFWRGVGICPPCYNGSNAHSFKTKGLKTLRLHGVTES